MANVNPSIQQQANVANRLFERGKFDEALAIYKVMADAGSVEAQLRVAWMHETGRGVKVNLDEARRWYLRAAESNSPEAQFYLGKLYGRQKLYQQALQYLQKSADQQYMPSIYQLGVMYELGEGVDMDQNRACQFYDQAARMGHLRAQRDLALIMVKGRLGVKKVAKGIFMLLCVLYYALTVGLKDPESDRIRW